MYNGCPITDYVLKVMLLPLWLFVQPVLDMKQHILRQHVAAYFCASLSVESIGDVRQLAQYVVTVEHENQVALHC